MSGLVQTRSHAKMSQAEMRKNLAYGTTYQTLTDEKKLVLPASWDISERTLKDWSRVAYRFAKAPQLIEQLIDVHVPSHVIVQLSSVTHNCSYTDEEIEEFLTQVRHIKAPATDYCNSLLRRIRSKRFEETPTQENEEGKLSEVLEQMKHLIEQAQSLLQKHTTKNIPEIKEDARQKLFDEVRDLIIRITKVRCGGRDNPDELNQHSKEINTLLARKFGSRSKEMSTDIIRLERDYILEYYKKELEIYTEQFEEK